MFACVGGGDADEAVPVFRSGHDHRVDVATGEHVAKIAIGFDVDVALSFFAVVFLNCGLGVGGAFGVHIADCDDTGIDLGFTTQPQCLFHVD